MSQRRRDGKAHPTYLCGGNMIPIPEEEWESCARYKFLEQMDHQFKTPDGKNFLLISDSKIDEPTIQAIVNLDTVHNQVLGLRWSVMNIVFIRSITVLNDIRGVGMLGVLCAYLQRFADNSGAFICGVAKPFENDLPVINNKDQLNKYFREQAEMNESFVVSEKLKRESVTLRNKYIEYGFCGYVGAGLRFQNKFMKGNMFGYLGARDDLGEKESYFVEHLAC